MFSSTGPNSRRAQFHECSEPALDADGRMAPQPACFNFSTSKHLADGRTGTPARFGQHSDSQTEAFIRDHLAKVKGYYESRMRELERALIASQAENERLRDQLASRNAAGTSSIVATVPTGPGFSFVEAVRKEIAEPVSHGRSRSNPFVPVSSSSRPLFRDGAFSAGAQAPAHSPGMHYR
jgi:hypothetical protein